MTESVPPVLADWTGHSMSRDAATSAKEPLNMKEVSSIDVNFVKMRVAVSEKSKFKNASIKREEMTLGGCGMTRAFGTLAPHLSWSIVINGSIPSRLSTRH